MDNKKKHKEMWGDRFSPSSPDSSAFLKEILSKVQLPKKHVRALGEDFLRLFAFYEKNGLTDAEIRERVGENILGDFYRPADKNEWYRLDSAAKVYPLSMTHTHMTVFRVSAYLSEKAEPCVLQVALHAVLKRFPLFSTACCRGMFWHYFDAIRRPIPVREEAAPPCSFFKLGKRKTPCFQVLYHKNRVSLEIFHALTDGTGAMVFLKTLIREYLRLRGKPQGKSTLPEITAAPRKEEAENAFSKAERKAKGTGFMQKMALQPGKGHRKRKNDRVLHFIMPTDALRQAAKTKNVTVTVLLTETIFRGVQKAAHKAKDTANMQVQIPVNMRKFYPSETLRNFSLYAVISLAKGTKPGEEMRAEITRQLTEQTGEASLSRMLYSANQMATNPLVRIMPLELKNFVLKKIYGILGEKVLSATLSNLGAVETEFGDNVQFFDFVLGATSKTNIKCTLISYGETSVFTVTDSLRKNPFGEVICQSLAEMEIPFYIEGVAD